LAGGGDPRDTVAIRRSRLDAVVAMRRFRGAWVQLRAGMNDAVAPFWLHGRRLGAEREAEWLFEMSPALLAVAGFDGYLGRFNPAFEVFGYPCEELLSRPWIEFAHPFGRSVAASTCTPGRVCAQIQVRADALRALSRRTGRNTQRLAAAFARMRERDASRSRARGRSELVPRECPNSPGRHHRVQPKPVADGRSALPWMPRDACSWRSWPRPAVPAPGRVTALVLAADPGEHVAMGTWPNRDTRLPERSRLCAAGRARTTVAERRNVVTVVFVHIVWASARSKRLDPESVRGVVQRSVERAARGWSGGARATRRRSDAGRWLGGRVGWDWVGASGPR
jgi:hypothetical protein